MIVAMLTLLKRNKLRVAIAGLLLVGVGAVAVPWLYINVFSEEPPAELSFEQRDQALAATSANDEGSWTIGQPSLAGYRVNEVIAGQDKVAVGRTSVVDGSFVVSGGMVTAAEVNVDVASMASDSERRDAQFHGRIMASEEFPVATFTLTDPVPVPAFAEGTGATASVAGTLSIRGVDLPVSFDVAIRRTGATIELVAKTTVIFADFGIPNPSIGPVKTEDQGVIEVSVTATKEN
jgi:polyisoprenoid-binding protein YceI